MDPTRLMTQTATVTPMSTPSTDDLGNPVLTAGTAFDVDCWMHQSVRDEEQRNQDVQSESWRIYFPAGTPLDAVDQVAVDGITYQVSGPPWPAFNPRLKRVTHVEATLVRAQ